MRARIGGLSIALLTAGLCGQAAYADRRLGMPSGVAAADGGINDLHVLILWLFAGIGALVYAAMIHAIVTFRQPKGREPSQLDHGTRAEVLWTIVAAAIVIATAAPSAMTLMRPGSSDAALTIKVTGYQWVWHYEYADEGVEFFSSLDRAVDDTRPHPAEQHLLAAADRLLRVDQPVVVPVDTEVRLLVTSGDVVYSWWVPGFDVRQDAVPGSVNETRFHATELGTYRGRCAEPCGMAQEVMPIVIEVRALETYRDWLRERSRDAVPQAR